MSWDPVGKVAVVTGASSGIGRATALRLAAAGMTVVSVARREARLEELEERHDGTGGPGDPGPPGVAGGPGDSGPPGVIVAHPADVTDQAAVDGLAARVRDEFGVCHALVNNAGVGGGRFEGRDDLDDALATIDVNLLGTVRCAAAFADLLAMSAPSRMVNVASVAGKLGLGPAAYAASKFGVVGFSEALAFSWARRGITVCQLNPGFVETEGFPQRQIKRGPMAALVEEPEKVAEAILDALVSGTTERTVPRFYRAFVVARHVAAPAYRAIAARLARAGGTRD